MLGYKILQTFNLWEILQKTINNNSSLIILTVILSLINCISDIDVSIQATFVCLSLLELLLNKKCFLSIINQIDDDSSQTYSSLPKMLSLSELFCLLTWKQTWLKWMHQWPCTTNTDWKSSINGYTQLSVLADPNEARPCGGMFSFSWIRKYLNTIKSITWILEFYLNKG